MAPPSVNSAMEKVFQEACAMKFIPGATLMASDRTGKFAYSGAFGTRSLHQCVDRQLINLDQDVRPILYELNDINIITPTEDGGFTLAKNQQAITLRQLLSHTSGFGYEFNSPLLQKWRAEQNEPASMTLHGRYTHPLLFEPGTSWSYGPSIDWAGLLVERVSGSESLQDYMSENIWAPLGIHDMTFFLSKRPDLQNRAMSMSFRHNDEHAVVYADQRLQYNLRSETPDAQGGGGIYTSAREYIKVLQALLRATHASASDEKVYPTAQLLRRSTANAMFEPQLKPAAIEALQATTTIPRFNRMLGGMPVETRKDWGLGGMLTMNDLPGGRRQGTMSWGGMPNLTWWIDHKAGLCGFFGTQVLPNGDEKSVELTQLFEKTMYEGYAAEISDQEHAI